MSKFWEDYRQVEAMLKQAFIQIPGGQPQSKEAQDPAMAGGAPMDPAMAGGLPPMDPAMSGGVPPEMTGGVPPMDPAMAGMMPPPDMAGAAPGAGAPGELPSAAPGSPMITITLDQLFSGRNHAGPAQGVDLRGSRKHGRLTHTGWHNKKTTG